MTSKQKQNNRYAAAERRILRVRYPQNPAARKLCQLDEQRNRYSKAIDEVFGGMYRRGFRPGIDNENPAFRPYKPLAERYGANRSPCRPHRETERKNHRTSPARKIPAQRRPGQSIVLT